MSAKTSAVTSRLAMVYTWVSIQPGSFSVANSCGAAGLGASGFRSHSTHNCRLSEIGNPHDWQTWTVTGPELDGTAMSAFCAGSAAASACHETGAIVWGACGATSAMCLCALSAARM